MYYKNNRGQSVLEYAVILAIVVAAIVALQIYFKRSIQGRFKQSADQVGEQFTTNPTEQYTIETITQSARKENTLVGTDSAALLTGGEKGWWTRSEILPAGAWTPGERQKDYEGYEMSKTDYVTPQPGDVGKHSTFKSGDLGSKRLWDDD